MPDSIVHHQNTIRVKSYQQATIYCNEKTGICGTCSGIPIVRFIMFLLEETREPMQ